VGHGARLDGGLYLSYGQARVLAPSCPCNNLIVIAASLAIAVGIGWLLTARLRPHHPRLGDNREMARPSRGHAVGLRARLHSRPHAGHARGALVIPATAAMSEMGIELIVEAFAVVVIGGLAACAGLRGRSPWHPPIGRHLRLPELEMLLIYLIVIAVLLWRPRGLFGPWPVRTAAS